ncbi:MAG: hypothetical protein K5644_06430 [Lachnospiraceae bacterium]|nr:hypothetical protein [Lachnospiraceae bacterium]
MNNKKSNAINITILLLIFIGGVIFHYVYGTFSKSVEVLPDEIRYYSIGRSIFQGDGLTFRGVATDYQKMGYAFVLLPFYFITDGVLRMKAITLCNSILMMLCIFPLSGIMSRLKVSDKVRYMALALFIIFPDLMYSATFMAEVLYWPALILFVYLWMINREKKSILISVVLGVVAYIGYMTKEIFLAVILSIVAFEIAFPIIQFLVNKKDAGKEGDNKRVNINRGDNNRGDNRKLRNYFDKKTIIDTLIICAVFVVLHIVIKLIFFAGMGNSYNQMSLDVLGSGERIAYLLYGFVYYIAAMMIACLVVPFIVPSFAYRQMRDNARGLYIFNVLCILASMATIAYTITVREDFPQIMPRTHFRYLGPYIVIALVVFLLVIDAKYIHIHISKSVIITLMVTFLLTFAIFRGVQVTTGVDQFVLDWVHSIHTTITGRWGLFLVNVIVVIVSTLTIVMLVTERKKAALIITAVVMIVLGIVNTVTAKNRLVDYMYRDEALVQSAMAINDYMADVDGGILYIADYGGYESRCKCIDTFLDKNSNTYYTTYHMTDNMSEGTYDVHDLSIPMQFDLWEMRYNNINTIDYVIKNNNGECLGLDIDNLTRIAELSNEYYTVYKNNEPSTLVLRAVEGE